MDKKIPESGVLNLGLSSLVEADSTSQRRLLDAPGVIAAFDWIDQQRLKGVMPAALIVERAVAAISAVVRKDRTEELQTRIDRLIESFGATVSNELIGRLRAAESGELATSEVPDNWAIEVSPVPEETPIQQVQPTTRQPEWSRFAEMVNSVQQERINAPAPAPELVSSGKSLCQRFGLRTRLATALLLLFSLTYLLIGHSFGKTSSSAITEIHFARLRAETALSPISNDVLMFPRLEPLNQIGSLSSLAYEINTKSPVKAHEYGARQEPMRQPVPDDVQSVAVAPPAVSKKEALDFSKSNEPAVVRDLQVEQEQAEPENTFEFPPFIHKQKNQPAPDPHTRDGGLFTEQVTHFNPPRRYSITAATQVMSRPSYWAPRIGGYDPGDIISVDARMGNWFRVVSNFGESAYILAQDAVPE